MLIEQSRDFFVLQRKWQWLLIWAHQRDRNEVRCGRFKRRENSGPKLISAFHAALRAGMEF